MIRTATFSECGRYRYGLTRRWADGPSMGFMMFNPSLADAEVEDKTITRCIGFARREGFGGLIVVNLFPLITPYPAELLAVPFADRFGPEHDVQSRRHLEMVDGPLVAAWGGDGRRYGGEAVAAALRDLGPRMLCLGRTQKGAPRHPLYVRGDAALVPLVAAQADLR